MNTHRDPRAQDLNTAEDIRTVQSMVLVCNPQRQDRMVLVSHTPAEVGLTVSDWRRRVRERLYAMWVQREVIEVRYLDPKQSVAMVSTFEDDAYLL